MAKFNLRQRNPVASYEASVHGLAFEGKKMLNAAVCTDCHGSHDLHRSTNTASKLYWKSVPNTCGRCHENVERTYLQSIHGKALTEGVRDTPVCTDCHGEHSHRGGQVAHLAGVGGQPARTPAPSATPPSGSWPSTSCRPTW